MATVQIGITLIGILAGAYRGDMIVQADEGDAQQAAERGNRALERLRK